MQGRRGSVERALQILDEGFTAHPQKYHSARDAAQHSHLLERFPGRLNLGYFHAGANMIQASCWEEASMGCRSHTRKTCAPVWSQRLKLGPPDRKLRTNTV